MNQGHGRYFFFLILLFVEALIGSTDYNYKLSLSKRSLYLKEPLVLTFEINQTDSSKVMFFDFNIVDSKDIFVHRLDKRVDEGYHARKEHYTYLIYPLKTGELSIDFKLLVRRGNDEMLTTAFTGGRYNVKAVETDDRYEAIESEKIEVKPLPVKADLVGRYTVARKVESTRVKSFEPLYIEVTVSGVGYAPDLDSIEWMPPVPGVRFFKDKPKIETRYTEEGIETKAIFGYALIGEKSYTLPKLRLQAFDTKEKKAYNIVLEALNIDVMAVKSSILLDEKSVPPPIEPPFESVKRFILYILIFAAGWISAILAMKFKTLLPSPTLEDEWRGIVKSCSDPKDLLKLLLKKDPSRYKDYIERLERSIYEGEKIDMKALKREVLNDS